MLLQEVFALLLIDIFASLRTYIHLQLKQLNLLVKCFQRLDNSCCHRVGFQHIDFVTGIERQIRTNEIYDDYIVSDIADSELRLVGNLIILLDILCRGLPKVVNGSVKLFVFGIGYYFVGRCCSTDEIGSMLFKALQTASA